MCVIYDRFRFVFERLLAHRCHCEVSIVPLPNQMYTINIVEQQSNSLSVILFMKHANWTIYVCCLWVWIGMRNCIGNVKCVLLNCVTIFADICEQKHQWQSVYAELVDGYIAKPNHLHTSTKSTKVCMCLLARSKAV